MPKKIIYKQQIINAAQTLVANDRNPTLAAVRKQLNYHGSNSTIHKYLKEWKKNCLAQNNVNTTVNTNNQTNIEELIEKQYGLEKNLKNQITQKEHYIEQLISAEKINIDLKEENHKLQVSNQELTLRLNTVEATNNVICQIVHEINSRLDNNENKTIHKMQQTIDDLRLELKTLHETSINTLRETSNNGHEVLMQEKVNSINLQTKINSLTKELLETKKQLHEAIMTSQVQNRSLSRQNEESQKIIQEHGLEKLPPSEGASLQFINGVAAYGK